MKKILIICANASTYHAPIFRQLSTFKKDLKIEVLYGKNDLYEKFYNHEYGIEIKKNRNVFKGYKFKILKNYFNFKKGFLSRCNFSIVKEIINRDADYVFLFGYDNFTSLLAYLTSLVSGKKILWRGESIIQKKRNFIKLFIKKIILTIYFFFVHKIFYSCQKNKDYLLQYTNNKKLSFYPCCVDNDYFRSLNKKKSKINNKIIILTACRLTKRKNLKNVLDGIYEAKKKYKKNLEYLVIGDGPERFFLKNYAKKLKIKTKFFGFLSHKDMSKYLIKADIFCLLSNFDASPKILNEVMNFKIPIIASKNIGTAGDLIKNNFNGFLVENQKQFVISLFKLLNDKNVREKFGKNGIKILDRKFNIKNCIQNIYKSLN